MAAIFIIPIVAVTITVGVFAPLRRCTVRNMPSRDRGKRNTSVDTVPPPAINLRQPKFAREDVQGHPARPDGGLLRPTAHSVGSLPPSPPAYAAHHRDPRYDGATYGYGYFRNSRGIAVDEVPLPLPPPDNAGPDDAGSLLRTVTSVLFRIWVDVVHRAS